MKKNNFFNNLEMKNKLSVNIFQYMLEKRFNTVIHYYYYLKNDLTIFYLQNHYSTLSKNASKCS